MKNRDLFAELSSALVEAKQHSESLQTFNGHPIDAESGVIPAGKTSTMKKSSTKAVGMSDDYDFSKMKSLKNPYPAQLKKPDSRVKRHSDEVGDSFEEECHFTLLLPNLLISKCDPKAMRSISIAFSFRNGF